MLGMGVGRRRLRAQQRVFSSGQGTCWRDALLRLPACMSEVGTSFHIAAGKRFQTSANCLPQ